MSWDEEKVRKLVECMSSGTVWLKRAKKCFDDQALASVDVEDLVGMESTDAKTVLSPRKAVRMVMPNVSTIAQAELVQLQKLELHCELLRTSVSQILAQLKDLPSTISENHTQIDKVVHETVVKWEQARLFAHSKLDAEHIEVKKTLEAALTSITENQRAFEGVSSSLYSTPISGVMDESALKQRQAMIASLSQQSLDVPFSALSVGPSWRVKCIAMPIDKPLVHVVSSSCDAIPPLVMTVKSDATTAEVIWSLGIGHSLEGKFQYHLQLAGTSVSPEGAPSPATVQSGGEYHDVYCGDLQVFHLRQLKEATKYSLRLRLEYDSGYGAWNLASFDTSEQIKPRGRLKFDVAGSYKWVVPPGVTEVNVIVIGGGGGGGGFGGDLGSSRFGNVVATGGEVGYEGEARGGKGNVKNGGNGHANTGGGAAGGEDGKLDRGGSTMLKYAGHGGDLNDIHHSSSGPFGGQRGLRQGAQYGGGAGFYEGGKGVGGGGGGYSQATQKVVPGDVIDIVVEEGGNAQTVLGGNDGLVVVAWGEQA